MEMKISIQNNGVSMPVFEGQSMDIERRDTGFVIEVTWENGDVDLIRLPIPMLNEVLKTARWAKRNHPAFKGTK